MDLRIRIPKKYPDPTILSKIQRTKVQYFMNFNDLPPTVFDNIFSTEGKVSLVPLPVLGVGAGSFNQLGTALDRADLWALIHGYHKKV
jgi:hypothetical protein